MGTTVDGARPRTLRIRHVLLAAGVVLAEAVLGMALATGYGRMAAAAVLGAAALALLIRLPFAAACALFVLAASALDDSAPQLVLAGRTVYPYELVLAGLLALALARPRQRTWGGACGLALALFLGMLAVSSLVAVRFGGADLNNVVLWGRVFFVLTFFWVVVRLFPTRAEVLRLVKAATIIGGLSGFVAVLFALGVDHEVLFKDSGDTIVSGDGTLRRVRLPGLALSFTLLWLALLYVVRGTRPRWLWWTVLAGSLLNVLLSQNRNMWVAGIGCLGVLLLVAGPRPRARVIVALATLGASLALLVTVPYTSESALRVVAPLVERGQTLLDPRRVAREDSLKDRARENRSAWASVREQPLLGVAPGVPWGLYMVDRSGPVPLAVPQLFLHNQYLYLLVITGVPGLVLFATFLFNALRAGFAPPRRPLDRHMLAIGAVGLALTAFVMLSLTYPSYLLALMLAAGAIVVLGAADRRGES